MDDFQGWHPLRSVLPGLALQHSHMWAQAIHDFTAGIGALYKMPRLKVSVCVWVGWVGGWRSLGAPGQ